MFQDICHCDVSLTSMNALTSWNKMVRAFLAHGSETPVHLGAVLDAEPEFAMGHAAKGLFSLMLARRELVAVARDALKTARKNLEATGGTDRERAWTGALEAWLNARPGDAVVKLEEVLKDQPYDTLSMKVSHAIRFMIGDAPGMRRSVERVLPAHGEDHPLRGYLLGCHAFSLEETGDFDLAERAGLEALGHVDDDAWGLHAVAHVYDMTHRPDRGIDLIDANRGAWDHCNNFRYHVWWHKALLHLDRGETDTVLTLYDEQIRQEKTDDYRDFSNASSLLMRLELDGISVGDRWAELADLAETRLADGCLVFADLHYVLALAADDRDDAVARLTARVARDAGPQNDISLVNAHPGVAATEGLAAFGEGRYGIAFAKLSAARSAMVAIGGSHAQRDVFERLTIDAGIRAGRLAGAETILRQRTELRAGKPDRFGETRMAMIAAARHSAALVAAE